MVVVISKNNNDNGFNACFAKKKILGAKNLLKSWVVCFKN